MYQCVQFLKKLCPSFYLSLTKYNCLIHYFVISYYIKIFLGLNAKLFFKEYKSNKKKILYFNFKYNKFIKLALLAFHNNISNSLSFILIGSHNFIFKKHSCVYYWPKIYNGYPNFRRHFGTPKSYLT